MPTYVRQTGTLQQRFEVTVDNVLCVHGRTDDGGEHQTVILPVRADPKLFLYLSLTVASERFYGSLRQVYGPAAGVLRFGEDEVTGSVAVSAHTLELAVHAQGGGVEVYV